MRPTDRDRDKQPTSGPLALSLGRSEASWNIRATTDLPPHGAFATAMAAIVMYQGGDA